MSETTFLALCTAVLGLAVGYLIGFASEYYTSDHYAPVKRLAKQAETGHATVIIAGVAEGMISTVASVVLIVTAIGGSFWFGLLAIVSGVLELLETRRLPDGALMRSSFLSGEVSILSGILLWSVPALVRRAFKRPVDNDDIADLMPFYEAGRAERLTKAVARYYAKLLAIKGSANVDAEILTPPRKIDLNTTSTKASRYGLQVYMVGGTKAKDLLFERLKLTGSGPGRMHAYKGVRADYFDQLLAEVKAPSRKHGGKKVYQKKAGAANEALDCEQYQIHLARYMRLHLKKPSDWDDIEAGLMQADLLAEADEQAPVTADPSAIQPAAAKPAVSLADLGRMMNGDD